MSGPLLHSVAEIVQKALIDAALATDPEDEGAWPAFFGKHPDKPDSSICTYQTEGRMQGRAHNGGDMQGPKGIQIRIRADTASNGQSKARGIITLLDRTIRQTSVSLESSTYLIEAITRTGDAVPLGPEIGASHRRLFTINAVVTVRQVS